jgi:hypothetical protein
MQFQSIPTPSQPMEGLGQTLKHQRLIDKQSD